MTGPKNRPTTPVPCFWMANRAVSTTTVTGRTRVSSWGATTFRPSTALNTEMAGVIMLSP